MKSNSITALRLKHVGYSRKAGIQLRRDFSHFLEEVAPVRIGLQRILALQRKIVDYAGKMMTRLLIPIFAAVMAVPVAAQDPVQVELAQLRKMIEQQNTKIDTLSLQVAQLSAQLGNRGAAPAVSAVLAAPAPVSAKEEFAPIPRIVANAPKVHIVVKGESLEKIAKLEGTTVAELQKLNNITDPKKLQVGQQLALPAEKKE